MIDCTLCHVRWTNVGQMANGKYFIRKAKSQMKYWFSRRIKDWLWWRWQMFVKIVMAAVTPPGPGCGGGIRLSENYVHWAPLNMIESVLSENPRHQSRYEREKWIDFNLSEHIMGIMRHATVMTPTQWAALWLMTNGHQRVTSLSRGLGFWDPGSSNRE